MANIRLLDSTNKPKALIDYAIEIGLAGICVTEHECLSSHIEVNKYAQEIIKEYPNFKIALGNEIYLTKDREKNQKYFHYILIAKDKEGHRQLRQLSSVSWLNSYFDRGMERVPTTKEELEKVIKANPGHLISTTACIGGELGSCILELETARKLGDSRTELEKKQQIIDFVLWNKELFGEDFYFEVASAANKEQIIVNKKIAELSIVFGVKMVIGSDAHYLRKEDRYVHEAFLNSKGGEREVASFYEYAYLQTEDEIKENLSPSIVDLYEQMCKNSMEIYDKIENYSLLHSQQIPKVKVPNIPKGDCKYNLEKYPTLKKLNYSDNNVDKYWLKLCIDELIRRGLIEQDGYLDELELEAKIKDIVGERLQTNMRYYPITLKHYIDFIWSCGSPVAPGRGSAPTALNHYLLDITQVDPLKYNQNFRRYMNEGTSELGDIDIDLSPSKKEFVLQNIKNERGKNFIEGIDNIVKENCGCVIVSVFGTETSKSAILTACRGYRGEGSGYTTSGVTRDEEEYTTVYHEGIDIDTAQYLSSLIPQERGFLWDLHTVIYGDESKGRKPVLAFINEINKYPGLLDIMMGIEGLISRRGSHASGVILFDEDPYEFGCFMKTPSGDVITQYDLHGCEAAGMTKYDFLVTSAMDKIAQTIYFLQENKLIDPDLTLREAYDKYLHPDAINFEDEEIWQAIKENKILDLFQFNSVEGAKGIKAIQPDNLTELSNVNGLIRLVAPEGSNERPIEKYQRFKNNPQLWYDEMHQYNLTEDNIKTLEKYYKISYGISISQENFLFSLGDPGICGWPLSRCNDARRIVSKKKMDKLPILKQEIINEAITPELGKYYWDNVVLPISSYAFSDPHALAYGMIAYQMALLATKWNHIYWDTACLVVNSGSLEDSKDKGTDYAKIAKAIGIIKSKGVKVSLLNINTSDYGFKPDVENNRILYGLKALSNIGDDVVEKIKENRPYVGIKDFMNRCTLTKTAMINLIKAGAFDEIDKNFNNRKEIMAYYLFNVCDTKKRLTLQNFNGLIQHDLIPKNFEMEVRIYNFTKYLKKNRKAGSYFDLDEISINFLGRFLPEVLDLVQIENGKTYLDQKTWDKYYQSFMDNIRVLLKDNQEEMLKEYNTLLFKELWDKYASGNTSKWEMDSLCFYYGEHELAHIDNNRYGIVNFKDLSPNSDIDYFFKRNGRQIPIYKLYRIAGTVLAKNDNRHSVTLLTTTGVVNVKFTRDYYATFKKQISQIQPDGTKKVMEKGWFSRGNLLMITGYRREDTFVSKSYSKTVGHQLYKIAAVQNGEILLQHERWTSQDAIEEDEYE